MLLFLLLLGLETAHSDQILDDHACNKASGYKCFSLKVPKTAQERRALIRRTSNRFKNNGDAFSFESAAGTIAGTNNLGTFHCGGYEPRYHGYAGLENSVPLGGIDVPKATGVNWWIGACTYIESFFNGTLSEKFDTEFEPFNPSLKFDKEKLQFLEPLQECNFLKIQVTTTDPPAMKRLQCFKKVRTFKTLNGKLTTEYSDPGIAINLEDLKTKTLPGQPGFNTPGIK
jgi:hypothetical protein